MRHSFLISEEKEMLRLGEHLKLAAHSAGFPGCIIYLKGDLGAGKTTLIRGFIQAFDKSGLVKSPTYTLVEPYCFDGVEINHFDFYRINDPVECEDMGIRDYMSYQAYCLIEWPSKGAGILPKPQLLIDIALDSPSGRTVMFESNDQKGQQLLRNLVETYV